MAGDLREPAEVDGLGRRVEKEAQLRASQKDRAVDGQRGAVCKLKADDSAAKRTGEETGVSQEEITRLSKRSGFGAYDIRNPATGFSLSLGLSLGTSIAVCLKH